jgi:ADP-heptose:LPS heptosyltransferase
MKTKLMRFLDFWLGLPACFLLSVLNSLSKILFFLQKRHKPVPEKILFLKLSEIGAIVLTYPLIKRVKEEYPQAELFFVTFSKNRGIFTLLGGIIPDKNILTIREGSLRQFFQDIFKAIALIRRNNIDIVLDLEFFSRATAILSYLFNAAKRVGFYRYTFEGLYRGNLFTHNIQYNPLLHISKTYLSFFETMACPKKRSPELAIEITEEDLVLPQFASHKEIKEQVLAKLSRLGLSPGSHLILINPGEGVLPLREWPLENFILLSRLLLEDPRNNIIIVGATDSCRKAALLCQALNNKRCINLVADTQLSELMELFHLADALVINDCGLGHLASLTGIRQFIFFGPESPQVFAPLGSAKFIIHSNFLCSPCLSAFNHRDSACRDNKCLKSIHYQEVYKIIRDSLP